MRGLVIVICAHFNPRLLGMEQFPLNCGIKVLLRSRNQNFKSSLFGFLQDFCPIDHPPNHLGSEPQTPWDRQTGQLGSSWGDHRSIKSLRLMDRHFYWISLDDFVCSMVFSHWQVCFGQFPLGSFSWHLSGVGLCCGFIFYTHRDPWDERYIYLHEWLIFMLNVGKYTMDHTRILWDIFLGEGESVIKSGASREGEVGSWTFSLAQGESS